MLDVVLFGALKKRASGLETWNEESGTFAFIIKLYHDFKQTMVQVNIWGAFSAIGFSYDITQNLYGLLFDEEKFRKVAASWNSGRVTRPWRVYRRGVNKPSLDGLTNLNKSVWFKKFAISSTGNEDMQSTG
jgi:hypothetical protein